MKDWVITIGIDKFYLTTEEKEYYLTSLNQGAKFVVLKSGKILGANFQSLVPTKSYEETKMFDEGKWICPYGKWHSKELKECSCDVTYEIEGTKAIVRSQT